jgi:dTDP-4-dehydrorhamnose reductase
LFALIGSRGYVGREFARQLSSRGISFLPLGRADCELFDVDALVERLAAEDATTLINCAGYTGRPNVDACELDKTNCLMGNAVLPGVIARACEEVGIPWGHVSSGCIYTGRRSDGEGFTEEDPPNFSFRQNNCSFYSGTKALGEEILADAERCYVWRLRMPFSNIDSCRNYLSKVMRYEALLEAENSLSHLPEFVSAAIDCFEKQLPFGIYNLTNPGSVTTSEVVELIRESGVTDRELEFFASEEEFMQRAASAPRSNCVLDSQKAIEAGLELSPIRDCIRASLRGWKPEKEAVRQ